MSGWLVAVVCLTLAGPAVADDDGDESLPTETQGEREVASVDRSRKVELLDGAGGHLVRPDGWVESDPSEGAAVVLHAAGVEVAQIELRFSEGIPDDRQRRYFDSFHSKLQSAGFQRVRGPEKTTYADAEGREVEYEGTARGGAYRLVVWTHHRDRRAWVATAFFAKEARKRLYPDFRAAVDSISFPDAPPERDDEASTDES